ncbi:hypothetical protein FS837_007853, partial [Tulasnella sp. UAMH 9824]
MFFGQLKWVLVVRLEPSDALKTTAPTSLALMDVHMCDASQDRYKLWDTRSSIIVKLLMELQSVLLLYLFEIAR